MERAGMSLDQIRLLAEAEHKMDTGELSYVVSDGGRLVVQPLVMEEFALVSGQTVSHLIVTAILEAHLALAKLALRRCGEKGER